MFSFGIATQDWVGQGRRFRSGLLRFGSVWRSRAWRGFAVEERWVMLDLVWKNLVRRLGLGSACKA